MPKEQNLKQLILWANFNSLRSLENQSSIWGSVGMEKVMNILKPKPNPQQLLRDWQRRLRQECRNIERQIRGIPFSFLNPNHFYFMSFLVCLILCLWVSIRYTERRKKCAEGDQRSCKEEWHGLRKGLTFFVLLFCDL